MKSSRGFSLIEVLVAMMIFAGAILVINNVWGSNLVRIRKARSLNVAAFLLQSKATEYEIKYAKTPIDELPEAEAGDFGSEYPNYSWQMTSRDFEMPDLSSAFGSEGNPLVATLVQTMTEFINEAVKEVKITVLVRGVSKKKKPLQYSLTTLFVDYNKDIAIPGIGGGGGSSNSDEGGSQ